MFQMKLTGHVPPEHFGHELSQMDPEFDDYRSILSEVCRQLEETGAISFVVQGFGEMKWRVDVATDLVVILEQLPALFSWASEPEPGSVFNLDFYEQGVERRLVLSPSEENIRVEGIPVNTGKNRWNPEINTEMIPKITLKIQITKLTTTFLKVAEEICPTSANHPWLSSHFSIIIGDDTPLQA